VSRPCTDGDDGGAAAASDGSAIPEPPVTGDHAVDEATATLAAASRAPLEQQVAAFDAAHRTLQDRLADIDG